MPLLNDKEQSIVRKAVENAEKRTSGEIRVCLEKSCKDEVLDRAAKYFYQLEMDKTAQRNGVLIYLAAADRKFAIIGDAGINAAVPENFWDATKQAMLNEFKTGNLVEGITLGVKLAGEQLQKFFPYLTGDKNELSDDIVFMDGE